MLDGIVGEHKLIIEGGFYGTFSECDDSRFWHNPLTLIRLRMLVDVVDDDDGPK
jgi:hypothetical protein